MILIRRREPGGPCPICGAAHSACTTYSGPVVVVQLPARDAAAAALNTALSDAPGARRQPLTLEVTTPAPAPGAFTTGTYKRKLHHPAARPPRR